MKKILYFILVAITVIFASCKDDFGSDFLDDPDTLPAATYMDLEEEQLMARWVELLRYTDMFNTLNLSANYTCFVPNNEAMDKYLASKSLSSIDQLNMAEAKLLVRYHTIKGAKYSSIDFRNGLVADSTASGDYLSTQYIEGGTVRINSESNIIKTISVTNGYIHTIDVVLTPVSETIWGILSASSEYSIMREAFALTGIKDRLDSIQVNQRKIKYTLLAVSDNVYKENGINDISALISTLGAESDYTNPSNELYKYAAYRILEQQVSYSSFASFDVDDTVRSKNYNTMAESQLFNISEVDQVLYVNYDKATASGVEFVAINKNAKNGVIHAINDIMPVKIPDPSTVQWELTDYTDLSAISFYRKSPGTDTQEASIVSVGESLIGSIKCYEYLTVPSSRLGWSYILANKNDVVRTKAKNSDILKLNLGLFGWIQMESPSIIAGKYKVKLEHANYKAQQAEGKLSIIIDGEYVGGTVTTRGKSKTSDSFEKTEVGVVEFTESKKHTLRILAGDDRVSEIDCLTFEPTN